MGHVDMYEIRHGYDTNRAKRYIKTDLVVTNKWKRWTQDKENSADGPNARPTRVACAASSGPSVLRRRALCRHHVVGSGSGIWNEKYTTLRETR